MPAIDRSLSDCRCDRNNGGMDDRGEVKCFVVASMVLWAEFYHHPTALGCETNHARVVADVIHATAVVTFVDQCYRCDVEGQHPCVVQADRSGGDGDSRCAGGCGGEGVPAACARSECGAGGGDGAHGGWCACGYGQ